MLLVTFCSNSFSRSTNPSLKSKRDGSGAWYDGGGLTVPLGCECFGLSYEVHKTGEVNHKLQCDGKDGVEVEDIW